MSKLPDDSVLALVEIDALVVLEIIKHCKDNLPELVIGQLLGLDVDRTLEVTNCFPLPEPSEEAEDPQIRADYQIDMMRCLREVNVDNNLVGWYQSAFLGSFFSEQMIETQVNYQLKINKCVVIVYDPLRTANGSLSLKAFRLQDSFVELYRKESFTQESLTKLTVPWSEIFEEVPIAIRNSLVSNACLLSLSDSPFFDEEISPFQSLDLSINSFLEKNLESLIDAIDDFSIEQQKFQSYQRLLQKQQAKLKRKAENALRRLAGDDELPEEDDQVFRLPTEPSQLNSLLKTNQINNFCQQINQFSGQSLAKLFLLNGLK
jgi:translation initiation factor 3 subunit H